MKRGEVQGRFTGMASVLAAVVSNGCSAEVDSGVAPAGATVGQLQQPISATQSARPGTDRPGPEPAPPPIQIAMRSFSANPSVGGSATSVGDIASPSYGALAIFMEKAAAYTQGSVSFSIANWAPTAPNTVIEQVGIEGDARDAAYDTGGALNPTWGLFYLSMAPFHLDYEQTLDWLYEGGGLELAQSLVDARHLNVKLIPVLSSNPQIAGHFKAPIGGASCDGERACEQTEAIGLGGLCSAGWTLRFLPPGQDILDRACDAMVADGSIPAKDLGFVNAISGLSNLGAIQSGAVTGFEQATPMDDRVLFFPELVPAPIVQSLQNPGHKGLRFLHFPSWHQPFLLGFVLLEQNTLWNSLTSRQQRALERAGRDALRESFTTSESVQCERLSQLLAFNDGQVQLDPSGAPILDASGQPIPADLHVARYGRAALGRLQDATEAYLDSLRGADDPTPEQLEFRQVHDSILDYERRVRFRWRPTRFPQRCRELARD
jgi:TRAP-type mannitol/chloroaromatic compound transport system substrate-binding protein